MAAVGPRKPPNARQANTGQVKDLRAEALAPKELVADLSLENRLLDKT